MPLQLPSGQRDKNQDPFRTQGGRQPVGPAPMQVVPPSAGVGAITQGLASISANRTAGEAQRASEMSRTFQVAMSEGMAGARQAASDKRQAELERERMAASKEIAQQQVAAQREATAASKEISVAQIAATRAGHQVSLDVANINATTEKDVAAARATLEKELVRDRELAAEKVRARNRMDQATMESLKLERANVDPARMDLANGLATTYAEAKSLQQQRDMLEAMVAQNGAESHAIEKKLIDAAAAKDPNVAQQVQAMMGQQVSQATDYLRNTGLARELVGTTTVDEEWGAELEQRLLAPGAKPMTGQQIFEELASRVATNPAALQKLTAATFEENLRRRVAQQTQTAPPVNAGQAQQAQVQAGQPQPQTATPGTAQQANAGFQQVPPGREAPRNAAWNQPAPAQPLPGTPDQARQDVAQTNQTAKTVLPPEYQRAVLTGLVQNPQIATIINTIEMKAQQGAYGANTAAALETVKNFREDQFWVSMGYHESGAGWQDAAQRRAIYGMRSEGQQMITLGKATGNRKMVVTGAAMELGRIAKAEQALAELTETLAPLSSAPLEARNASVPLVQQVYRVLGTEDTTDPKVQKKLADLQDQIRASMAPHLDRAKKGVEAYRAKEADYRKRFGQMAPAAPVTVGSSDSGIPAKLPKPADNDETE